MRILVLCLFLIGCSGSASPDVNNEAEKRMKFVLSGQSNVQYCDWSEFPFEVDNIAMGGAAIQYLIGKYENKDYSEYDGIIFVHGETDSKFVTGVKEYASDVEIYRRMIGDLPMFISTVGYPMTLEPEYRARFDAIRFATLYESEINPNWYIAFDDAYTFADRGMLVDEIHFNDEACAEMQDSIMLTIDSFFLN